MGQAASYPGSQMSTLIPIPALEVWPLRDHRSIAAIHLDLLHLSNNTLLGRFTGSTQANESCPVVPVDHSVSAKSLVELKAKLRGWFEEMLLALDG